MNSCLNEARRLRRHAPDGEAVILTVDDVTRVYRISDGATLSESVHSFPTWQRIAP